MYVWREIFELYLDAAVFFSTKEYNAGRRTPESATEKLEWFQEQVTQRGLISSFKMPESHKALDKFVEINITLLLNLKFQEINRIAIKKILKSECGVLVLHFCIS